MSISQQDAMDSLNLVRDAATVAMLGYIVIGLWSESSFLIVLGLAVTGLTLPGYGLIPTYFYLWMAPTGGGALLGTGLYIRTRWR